jgi:hypothetical protein
MRAPQAERVCRPKVAPADNDLPDRAANSELGEPVSQTERRAWPCAQIE